MRTIIARDLWFHRDTWIWTLLALTVSATCVGTVLAAAATVAAAIAQGAPGQGEAMGSELQSLTSVLMTFIGIGACAVISTSTRLVVTSQTRTYALWKVLGMRPGRIRLVICGQVALLAGVAGILASVLAPVAALVYIRTWRATGLPITGHPGYSPTIPVATVLVTTLFGLVGAWTPVRRATRVDELQALQEAVLPTSRVRRFGLLCGLATIGMSALCFFAGFRDGINSSGQPDGVVAGMLLLLCAALTWAPWTLRGTLAAWTSWDGPATHPVWHLARAAVRRRSTQSISAALPYALSLSLIGTLYGAVAAAGVEANGVGMLLGLVLPISMAGGMGTVAMCGAQRRSDGCTLDRLGLSHRQISAVDVMEGAAYGITGALFGWVFTIGSTLTGCALLHTSVRTGLSNLPWTLLVLLTICSLVIPTATAWATGLRGGPERAAAVRD